MSDKAFPREGELYKRIEIAGHTFDILYGFYTEAERDKNELTPIFPDFEAYPVFSQEGHPLVNRIQDACEHYCTKTDGSGDGWCADCIYFPNESHEIGICSCIHRRCSSPLSKAHEHEQPIFIGTLAEA